MPSNTPQPEGRGGGAFSPDAFKAQHQQEFASPATFMMYIPGPIAGGDSHNGFRFLCNQSVVPGRHFATNEYTTHGPIQRMPYQSIYDMLQVSILCSSDLAERTFFGAWQNKIQSDKTYEWEYFRNYVQDLELWYFSNVIPNEKVREVYLQKDAGARNAEAAASTTHKGGYHTVLSDGHNESMIAYKVKFCDAYPLTIQPLTLDWGAKDTILNLQVTFSYTKWETMPAPYKRTGTQALGFLEQDGPTMRELLSWASDTIDLVDLYTGTIPSWLKTAQQISGTPGAVDGVINAYGSRLLPR